MSLKRIDAPLHDEQKHDAINNWFSDFIDNIKTDHFLLSQNVATEEKHSLYNDLIFGDGNYAILKMRETSSIHFIGNIIKDYLKELKETYKKMPLKLALGISDSKILVWSEINDNDEATEDALLLAEAKVNGKYYQHGFYLNSTIIEKSDNLEVPPHYQKIIG